MSKTKIYHNPRTALASDIEVVRRELRETSEELSKSGVNINSLSIVVVVARIGVAIAESDTLRISAVESGCNDKRTLGCSR